jgi:3-hydroxybutyryl-CoA dehydrogenase
VESGRLGRKSGRGWYDHAQGAQRPEPRTAAPCEPPEAVGIHADLGPAATLRELIEEAGIKVAQDRTPNASQGFIALPDGTRLTLTDGTTAATAPGDTSIRFDLALDYRKATRIALGASDAVAEDSLRTAIGLFQALGKQVSVIDDVPGLIVARTVAMLVDFAADAVGKGVACAQDVDIAMRLGVNYPRGPLEWGDEIGAHWVRCLLWNLEDVYPGGRYAPSMPLLRRAAPAERLL